ncbi:MAG TPA: VOC family protein [Gaiellaceae bacterium]|nr:VOC family protein [Gaiellaceae bacterium]
MIRALDHLDLVVTSLERSQPFYQELLGLSRASEIEGERGERIVYLSRPGEEPAGSFALGLREKKSDAHAIPFDRYAVGVHHVAFEVESREIVDERAAWLRAQGAEIESGPEEYDYRPGYYAVFFYDPDGLKLELMYVP